MNKREKLLGLGLVVVLLGWMLRSVVDGFLFGAVRERSQRVADLEGSVIQKETQKQRTMLAERRTVLWQALSLPPDPKDAQRLYEAWLVDLVTELGFESPKVTSGQRLPNRDVYTTVVVDIEAEATYDALVRFLFLVQRTSLMHRIARIELDSTGTSPSDPLEVRIAAEGFSFTQAPPRTRLLPTARLAEPLDRGDTTVAVEDAAGFPTKPGFEVRIGGEFARVAAIDGDEWTIERGLHRSRAVPHAAGDDLELVPVSDEWRGRTLDDYEAFVAANPFAIPRRYEPAVGRLPGQTVYRGESVGFKLAVSGYDPSKGEPTFELLEGGEVGMQLDPATGEFTWSPGPELAAGGHDVRVRVTFPGIDEPIERAGELVLRERNESPVLASLEPLTVTQGEEATFTAAATDPEGTAIRYSLRGAPTGASIDPGSGAFTWPVGYDVPAGVQEFKVVAEDAADGEAARTVAVTVLENSARHTVLVGTIVRDGERSAWLIDETTQEKTTLLEGTWATLAGARSFVLVIGRNFVLLQQDDVTYRLDLGRSLDEMREQVLSPAS